MIFLMNFVLTSVNMGFTGVSMEITAWGLAVAILISCEAPPLVGPHFELNNYQYVSSYVNMLLIRN